MPGSELQIDEIVNDDNVKVFLDKEIEQNKLLLFIKGTADFPQCGFSAQVIEIFNRLGVDLKL